MSDHPFTEYREKEGLTQEELGDILGISRQMVGFIESGERAITAKNALEWEKLIPVSKHAMCREIFGPEPKAERKKAAVG